MALSNYLMARWKTCSKIFSLRSIPRKHRSREKFRSWIHLWRMLRKIADSRFIRRKRRSQNVARAPLVTTNAFVKSITREPYKWIHVPAVSRHTNNVSSWGIGIHVLLACRRARNAKDPINWVDGFSPTEKR